MGLWTLANTTTSMWLDGADASTQFDAASGGSLAAPDAEVLRHEDKSGNDWHVTNTAGNGPTRKEAYLNGLDGLQYPNAKWLTNASYSAEVSKAKLIRIAVAKIDTINNNFIADTPSSQASVQAFSASWFSYQRPGVSIRGGVADTSPHVFVSVLDGTQSATHADRIKLFIDGSLMAVSATGGTIQATTATGNGIDIGRVFGNSAASLVGRLFEYATIADEADLNLAAKITGSLAWKWGLQGNLPGDHPYKGAAPRTGNTAMMRRRRESTGGGL